MKRITIFLVSLFCSVCFAQERADSALLWQRFQQPPPDARPMMRWWWFGPAVAHDELDREIAAMKAGGFGGFEVQPVYALSTDDPSTGIVNTPYLSDPFLAALRHTSETARDRACLGHAHGCDAGEWLAFRRTSHPDHRGRGRDQKGGTAHPCGRYDARSAFHGAWGACRGFVPRRRAVAFVEG